MKAHENLLKNTTIVDNKNCCKICLIFFGAIVVLGLAVVLIFNSRNSASVTIAPEQVMESSDFFYGVSPALEANNKTSNGKSTAYLYGVPPAPPFKEIEITIYNNVTDGCEIEPNNLIGYIIDIREKDGSFDLYLTIIIQDENGVRHKCYLDSNRMANAAKSELPYILIPGNKVEMKVESCGSGGFINIMHMKSLKRE